MDQTVGGKNHRAAKRIVLIGKIAHLAASFLHEELARGGVPFLKAEFPEAIETASSHAGEIKRGGAVAADAVRAQREIPVVVNVGIGQALVNGKTGAEEAGREGFHFGDADSFSVERGALTSRGGVKFVVNPIVVRSPEQLLLGRLRNE